VREAALGWGFVPSAHPHPELKGNGLARVMFLNDKAETVRENLARGKRQPEWA